MKNFIIVSILMLSCLFSKAGEIEKISVSIFKSSFIYFDSPVVSTNLGMDQAYDVSYEKNYVKVTAIRQQADYQTNLTVTTKTGIYAFMLDYKDNPEQLYFFPEDYEALRRFTAVDDSEPRAPVIPVSEPVKKEPTIKTASIEETCKELYEMKMDFPIAGFSKAKVNFYMDKIYVRDNKFYLKMNLKNESNIDFDIDFIKFNIRNKKKIKRSSQQEIYLEPLCAFNNVKKLKANSSEYIVFALDKFTIMNDKQFFIQFEEKRGERNVEFQVMNRDIINAVEL